jgi:hypothetical protein
VPEEKTNTYSRTMSVHSAYFFFSIKPLPCRRWYAVLCMLFCFLLSFTAGNAQSSTDAEEIGVTLQVQHVGSIELPAVISNEQAYLPVTEVFNFIKIRNIPSAELDSVSGFFIHPKSVFLVDAVNKQLSFEGKMIPLTDRDLIKTETNLYLRSAFFGDVFGLVCSFNFRNLTVTLTTSLELPVMREVRLEQMRLNLKKLKGEKKADTIVGRDFHAFNAGIFDWSVTSSQQSNGYSNLRLNMAAGGNIAGGEASASVNYSTTNPLSSKQVFYRWRLVDNDRRISKQLLLGKYFPQSISTIYSPVIGAQVSNIPTTSRKSFGSYRISNRTQPGWTVELYVNNILVNAAKADASGFYSFEVPLVYGNSVVTLHFYGPFGEEDVQEENILIPFQFVPKNEFQYTFSSGVTDDESKSVYGRINANYGLGNRITVGGGWEYLSSIPAKGNNIPYLTTAVRLGSRLLLSGEYAYNVRTKTVVSYSLPSSMQFELNYIKYDKGQAAVKFNYLEERRFIFSAPMKTGDLFTFTRLSFSQFVLPKQHFTSAELLLSAVYGSASGNLTNSVMYYNPANPYVYSNVSFSFRMRKGYRISPKAQYEYREKRISMLKCDFEKNVLKKAFLTLSAEDNFRSKTKTVSLGFRYDLSFAQTVFSVKQSNNITTVLESARGSLMFDKKSGTAISNSLNNVGKAGIIVLPFLDLNNNGKRDAGEPKVAGLNLHLNGRNIQRSKHDTAIYITGLEAYNKYLIELDPVSFESVSWQLKKRSISVIAEPNQLKLLEVPVYVSGEVAGTVYMNGKGEARMIVCIYNSNDLLVAKTLTEPDGYFSYLGLPPGSYTTRIDSAQLSKLKLVSTAPIPFVIKPLREGDLVDGLSIILSQEAAPVSK